MRISTFFYPVKYLLNAGESGEISTIHMLLGIWSVEESTGHKIMATFGFDNEKAKELT